jgi:O-antigen ligase
MYPFFLASLLLAPIPFGANRPWAWCFYAVLVALLGLVFCVQVLLGKRQAPLIVAPALVSLLLFCIPVVWSLLQASGNVPSGWAHPFWQLAATQLPNTDIAGHISLAPQESLTALMRLGSYGGVFLLSLQFNLDSDKAALTFKALAYAGFAYAVYGLIVCLGHFNTILWFDKTAYADNVTSTFVNRNSYATYAGLTLLASVPLFFNVIVSSNRYGLSSNFGREYFFENVLLRGWFPLLLVFTIISALLLSQSRGGFLSTCLAVIVLLIILLASRKINKKSALLLLAVMIAAVSWLVLAQSFDNLMARFDTINVEHDGRLMVYALLEKATADNRWLGVGYGSFAESFRLYRDESITGFYDKAHNTYLENIFELGLLPAVSLFLAIAWTALVCVRGVWVRRRDWLYPALGVAASVLVGAHALVDFSLQIPAVALTYALIMGAAVAQSIPTRKS